MAGREYTFLAEIIGAEDFSVGSDPELPPEDQWIQEVRWHSLESVKEDRQVKLVIAALKNNPL
jgi:hypothetical protein